MQTPTDLQRVPGVFALLHAATAEAYVNETKDLKQRSMLWEAHLRAYEDGTGPVPAKDFPKYPNNEWAFWVSPVEAPLGPNLSETRKMFLDQGWKILNDYKPRKLYSVTIDGVVSEASLGAHCRRLGLKVHTVYKRLGRGMTIEQALNLNDLPMLDKRELAISQMRVQIESDNGGLLTYDEAIQLRPAVGDIREKIRRLRKKNPELSKVKLSEI